MPCTTIVHCLHFYLSRNQQHCLENPDDVVFSDLCVCVNRSIIFLFIFRFRFFCQLRFLHASIRNERQICRDAGRPVATACAFLRINLKYKLNEHKVLRSSSLLFCMRSASKAVTSRAAGPHKIHAEIAKCSAEKKIKSLFAS